MLRLAAGDAEAWLCPEIGGAVAAYRVAGRDVLRPAPPHAPDALAMACFPLVPYANRIADGRFAFAGRSHALPRNFGDHPHSLHGLGWQRRWMVADADGHRALLTHTHDGGAGWPWAYRAEQDIRIGPGTLCIGLSLTNASAEAMPAGLGLHPYFPLASATRLQFVAERCWETDDTCLPLHPAPADRFGDWSAVTHVEGGTLIDNIYEGWKGKARIEQADMIVELQADDANWLHLYRPPNQSFFCVEPVSHMPDAINRGTSITSLAPGETTKIALLLKVTES